MLEILHYVRGIVHAHLNAGLEPYEQVDELGAVLLVGVGLVLALPARDLR
jgi:hypothetical protein